jgi:hypothetical protein
MWLLDGSFELAGFTVLVRGPREAQQDIIAAAQRRTTPFLVLFFHWHFAVLG